MYQPLIWSVHLRDEAGRLAAALDSEKVQSAADALVDGVRGNTEFDGNLLGREMLVDEQEAIELRLAQPRHIPRDF
jgi:hypothetical protein